MLPPKAGSVLHTSLPWAVLTLSPVWDQPWLVLGGECCTNSPRNVLYPNVSSSRQPLQEVASHAGSRNRTPLTHCILSSPCDLHSL